MNWLKDFLYGKIDPNPVFDGMDERPRRNIRLRREFFERSKKLYQDEFLKYNGIVRNNNWRESDDKAKMYYYFVLKVLYEKGPESRKEYDSYLEDRVFDEIFDWIHIDTKFSSPSWKTALERLTEHTAAKHFLPSLFDGRMPPRWERTKFLRLDKIRREEEQKQAADKIALALLEKHKAADAPILANIDNLRQQVRALRELFYPLPVGHPEKTRLMYRIDATQNAIGDLKARLNLPIPKASEDWA